MSSDHEHPTSRLGALCGVGAGVLACGAFALSSGAPALGASGSAVIAFYTARQTRQEISDILWTTAYVAFVFFAGHLLASLRRHGVPGSLAAAAQIGAAVLACASTLFFGLDYVLAVLPRGVDPSVAQTVNVLSQQLFLPVAAGVLIFGLAIGLAFTTTHVPPVWLGWVAIAIALLVVTPFAIFAVLGMFVWALVCGVAMARRGSPVPAAPVDASVR